MLERLKERIINSKLELVLTRRQTAEIDYITMWNTHLKPQNKGDEGT